MENRQNIIDGFYEIDYYAYSTLKRKGKENENNN